MSYIWDISAQRLCPVYRKKIILCDAYKENTSKLCFYICFLSTVEAIKSPWQIRMLVNTGNVSSFFTWKNEWILRKIMNKNKKKSKILNIYFWKTLKLRFYYILIKIIMIVKLKNVKKKKIWRNKFKKLFFSEKNVIIFTTFVRICPIYRTCSKTHSKLKINFFLQNCVI